MLTITHKNLMAHIGFGYPESIKNAIVSTRESAHGIVHDIDENHPDWKFGPLKHSDIVFTSMPYTQWPKWVKKVAKLRNGNEKGVGDTVQTQLGIWGWLFKAMLKAVGVECGCAARKAEWNVKYRY